MTQAREGWGRPAVGRKKVIPPEGALMSTVTCSHLTAVAGREGAPARTPDGCEECLAAGTTWVSLRRCLECGHIGCCDSSPGRHATGHYEATSHPVIQSFEPGQAWRWCYPDTLTADG
jgi:uncharacterized UBP type Zn finger protein